MEQSIPSAWSRTMNWALTLSVVVTGGCAMSRHLQVPQGLAYCLPRGKSDIMRLETMKIRDALTLYEAPNSNEDTFFRRNRVSVNWIAMCLCQGFQTPGHQAP